MPSDWVSVGEWRVSDILLAEVYHQSGAYVKKQEDANTPTDCIYDYILYKYKISLFMIV